MEQAMAIVNAANAAVDGLARVKMAGIAAELKQLQAELDDE
jgi:hypothetical protein